MNKFNYELGFIDSWDWFLDDWDLEELYSIRFRNDWTLKTSSNIITIVW